MPKGISKITGKGFWKGKSRGKQTAELIERRISKIRGRKRELTPEWKVNIGKASKGRIPWNKGLRIAPAALENRKIRVSADYKLWRKSVVDRDGWKCVWCGSKENLEVDHIKPFALFPELRFVLGNGRTLCKNCHSTTPTYRNRTVKPSK